MLLWPSSHSQPCKGKETCGCSLLVGLQPLLPVQRKPLGLTEHHTAHGVGHRHRVCLQIQADLEDCELQVHVLSTRKKPLPNWEITGSRTTNNGQFSPFVEWLRPFSSLKTWCNSSLQHKELFAAHRNSTELKIRLKYFAELEHHSGGLRP